MNKFIITILLLGFTSSIYAKEIDITTNKGLDQEVIISLEPKPAQMDIDKDVTIKATFAIALDSKSVQKNNIKLKHITEKKESIIDGIIGYVSQDNAVTYQPNKNLDEGYYEIEIKSLKATKADKNTQIKEIKYRFYVAETINGYKLPLEPDESINNDTLLGVDVNDNGIRDDVERYIIKKYAQYPKYPKTKTALALQYAWASQKILENPTMESKKYIDDASDCQYYWANRERNKYAQGLSGFERVKYYSKLMFLNDPETKDKIYNTRERIEQKFSFNASLGDNIFDGRNYSIDNCRININELGE